MYLTFNLILKYEFLYYVYLYISKYWYELYRSLKLNFRKENNKWKVDNTGINEKWYLTFKGRQEKVNKKNKDYEKKPDLSFALKSKYLIVAAMEKVTN